MLCTTRRLGNTAEYMPDQSLVEFRLFTVERVGFRLTRLTNLTASLNVLSQTVHTQKAPPEIRTGKLIESHCTESHVSTKALLTVGRTEFNLSLKCMT